MQTEGVKKKPSTKKNQPTTKQTKLRKTKVGESSTTILEYSCKGSSHCKLPKMLSGILVLYLLVIPPTSCITLTLTTLMFRWHISLWTSDMKQMPYKRPLKVHEVQELRKKAAMLLVEKDLKPIFLRRKTWIKKILYTCGFHFAKIICEWKKGLYKQQN